MIPRAPRFVHSRWPLRAAVAASLLALAVGRPAAAQIAPPGGTLDVVARPPFQRFLEGGVSTITFRATNNTTADLVLDFALAIINGPSEFDDNVFFFPNVTFPNVILKNDFGDFTYGLDNTNGDPTDIPDAPDDGRNRVSFYLGMSQWNGVGVPGIINPGIPNFGVFLVNANGVGSTGTLDPAVLAQVNACAANPANPCNITGPLYTGGVLSRPFPAVATVIVSDLPEPGTGGLVLLGVAAAASWSAGARRRRSRLA